MYLPGNRSLGFRRFALLALLCLLGSSAQGAENGRSQPEIQQEHEGNLHHWPEDAVGSFFDYYAPTIVDANLIQGIVAKQPWYRRTAYWAKRKTTHRQDAFGALSLDAKIQYLEALDRDRGQENHWSGKKNLILQRRASAPDWLAEHPSFEAPPRAEADSPLSYWFPEVTSAKDQPARSIEEAVARARRVFKDTGMASSHFHVFIRLPPEELAAIKRPLISHLQALNDRYYLEATAHSAFTALQSPIQPWEARHSLRADEILTQGGEMPYAHDADRDPADPKQTGLALRYWGIEDGKSVISLELRLAGADLVRAEAEPAVRGLSEGQVPKKVRDFRQVEARLSELLALQEKVISGTLETHSAPARLHDLEAAEKRLAQMARAKGYDRFLTISEFFDRVFGLQKIPEGALAALTLPERTASEAFLERFAEISHAAAVLGPQAAGDRHLQYLYRGALRDWAEMELGRREITEPGSCPLHLLKRPNR